MINGKILENLKPLKSLKPTTLQAIAERVFLHEVHAGVSLVIEGLPAEYSYFLISGHVRVLRMNQEGRQQVLARLTPGAPLNVISLLKKERLNHASIETITSVQVIVLDAGAFDTLVEAFPDFSRLLLNIFADRISQMVDLASNLSLYTVRARLARFLIELADQPYQPGGWTQDEIAAHIGTVRDVVGRLLRQFESEGLITRDRQQITLLDRNRLLVESERQGH